MSKKSSKHGKTISEEINEALDAPRTEGKIRITTMVDMAVYDALKSEAAATGKKYQSILNEILLNHYFKPEKNDSGAWENEIGKILKRIEALEKKRTA